jgi:O-antigen/teichoic acid export membrane protein
MTGGPLRSLAERAFKWSALTTVGRFGLQLVAQVLLARLLGPDNYGVYGIGMVVLTFAAFLSGNAFSYILMLQQKVDDEDVRFAFTWQVVAGVACAALMLGASGWIADFFGDPRVAPMVRWLSLACLLLALAGPATCLLQRDLNFRALGLIQLASYATGYLLVGVPLALNGEGAQALAAACVVQAAVALVASYAARPHPVRPLLRHAMAAETLQTGRTVFSTNVINWLLQNVDRLLIGRLLNAQSVGLYSVAYNIASIPNVLLIGSLQPTFLATGAKLQGEPAQLARAWLTMLACIVVFLTPASVVMALLAGDLVQVLYGPAWTDSGWVMAVLFVCVPAWACWGLSTPVLWNTGRKHLEVLLQLPVLLLAVPLWWLLAPYGLRAIAMASAAIIFVRAVVIVGAGLRALGLRGGVLLPFIGRGLALGAICAAAVELGRHAGAALHHPIATLLAGGLFGLGAALAMAAVFPSLLGPEARAVLLRLIPAIGPLWATVPSPEVRP